MQTRPFRFGVQVASAPNASAWAEVARKAEELGYSTLSMPDHFGDQLAPIPAMMAAADATTTLRIGALVLDNDYKHPVVLAKELATLDVLSGGRLEIGLGAGWMTSDYVQSGIALDAAAVRVDRMEEGLAVLKGLFGAGSFDFAGSHYTVQGLDGLPKPAQQPHPPILIGGGGKRVLSIAAREADIIGINPSLAAGVISAEVAADATGEATDRKVALVREVAGERMAEIELNTLTFAVSVTDDRPGMQQMLGGLFGLDASAMADVPHAWIGSVDEICDDLQRWRERWGISYHVVQADALHSAAPIVAELTGA
jgi:probable F420-dependent oxidoreductase